MGHAAATARTSVLRTAASTLAAVEDVRSLGNALATEQGAIKARLDAAEQQQREIAAALELNLAAIRAKADTGTVLSALSALEDGVLDAHKRIEARRVADEAVAISLWRRLRWLVTGR